jgi:hypothetical protein
MKPLLMIGGAIAAAGLAAGAYVALPGGGEEEAVQQVATATPGASVANSTSPTASAAQSPGVTPRASAAPVATPAPVPEGWVTYTDPGGKLIVSYPQDWFLDERGRAFSTWHVYSYDPGSIQPGTKFSSGSVKIDIGVFPIEKGRDPDCAGPAPADSVPATVAGATGWRQINVLAPSYDESANGMTYSDLAVVQVGGECLLVEGYFAESARPNSVFEGILASLKVRE